MGRAGVIAGEATDATVVPSGTPVVSHVDVIYRAGLLAAAATDAGVGGMPFFGFYPPFHETGIYHVCFKSGETSFFEIRFPPAQGYATRDMLNSCRRGVELATLQIR